jgi:AcrR family transcriptional regulator
MDRSTAKMGAMPRRTVAVGLTREQIVEATLALMDEHGPAHLTMRHLADHLGVTAPTLYWHFGSRSELIDAAVDAALDGGQITTSDDPDWRVRVAEFMHGLRRRLTTHPWVTDLTRNRYPQSVHEMTLHAIEVAAAIGLGADQTADRARLMIWQVIGFTTLENNIRLGTAYHEPSGDGNATYTVGPPSGPTLRPPLIDVDHHLSTLDVDALFELHVRVLIAGIEALVPSTHTRSRTQR